MRTTDKGRIAEATVMATLVKQGYEVYLPALGNGINDMVAQDTDGNLYRVEVKYAGGGKSENSWEVFLCAARHNRTLNYRKAFSSMLCDVVAVYFPTLDEVAFLKAADFDGRSSVSLSAAMVTEMKHFPHAGVV